jgi:hypothetical protein
MKTKEILILIEGIKARAPQCRCLWSTVSRTSPCETPYPETATGRKTAFVRLSHAITRYNISHRI